MLNVSKKMVDDNNTCDSNAAGAQITLLTMHAIDERTIAVNYALF